MSEQWSSKINSWVHSNQGNILKLVEDFVKYNTVNKVTTGSEKEMQLYVAEVFRGLNMEVDMFTPEEVPGFREHEAYFPGRDYTDRPNVVGVSKGSGDGKSLIFSSHADTTALADGWDKDPWTPVIKDNKMYGFGTFDMKGGLAASIMALKCVQELGIPLKGDVLIESVVDEEFGGANGTLASRIKGYNPDAAIIPEPTGLAVCPASRGGAQWRVTFKGTTGMSFSGEKVYNPTVIASKFIVYLEEWEAERGKKPGPAPYYSDDYSGLPVMVTRMEAGDMTAELNDTGPTFCHVDIWVECHPNVTEEQLKEELMAGFREKYKDEYNEMYEPHFEKVIRFLHGMHIDPEFPLINILSDITRDVTDNKHGEITGAPFACDGFMFSLYSPTPAIILGPVGANAHAPDEHIDIPEFYKLVEIYAQAIVKWCS